MERIQVTPAPVQPTADPNVMTNEATFAKTLKTSKGAMKKQLFIPLLIVVLILGLGTGYVAAGMTSPATMETTKTTSTDQQAGQGQEDLSIKVGMVVGAKDTAFKDSAEGVLVAGGIGGEGSHHIVRPGGVSQNVYLTSSIMDLATFEGARVKVSGETFKGQKAGWLMDVGKLEVLQLNAPLPDGAKAPSTATGQDE